MKCGTSGILPVSRRKQMKSDDFSKSTSRLKSTNRDSSTLPSSFRETNLNTSGHVTFFFFTAAM